MGAQEIKKGVYWVGAVDWNVRNFHGYLTQQGTTYNAYLVVDEKVVLIDTVKKEEAEQMMSRIKDVIDPSKIDYVVSNHVEPDHSGAIPDIMEVVPRATVIASKKGESGLISHYKQPWNIRVVKTGDQLNIGRRTLKFFNIPMIHWPDSMATFLAEDKLLFPNDAFGQHVATAERYDDELGWTAIKKDAAKYFANIVMPFDKQLNKALESFSGMDIELICPSHGIIWRSFISKILREYKIWAQNDPLAKALIVYDSMWHSTESIAETLEKRLTENGLPVTMRNLKVNHISDIMTDVLASKLILLGSPTLNNGLLPTMSKFLTYMRGLRPKNRVGYAFGSYGWAGKAVGELEQTMNELKWQIPIEGMSIEFVPEEEDLDLTAGIARKLADAVFAN